MLTRMTAVPVGTGGMALIYNGPSQHSTTSSKQPIFIQLCLLAEEKTSALHRAHCKVTGEGHLKGNNVFCSEVLACEVPLAIFLYSIWVYWLETTLIHFATEQLDHAPFIINIWFA